MKMKKIIYLMLMALLPLASHAQYRDVKMPQQPKQSNYRDILLKTKGSGMPLRQKEEVQLLSIVGICNM